MRWAVVGLTVVACGRVGFEPRDDAFTQDAFTACVDGDGICPVACAGMDSDCQTVCGDGTCVGNAGELCGNCMADCATTAVVCGNARCQAGELPDCYADCGPSPWQWVTQETNLFNQVNTARMAGVTCPGETQMRTAPALGTVASSITRNAAREWAWEVAHHQFNGDPGQDGETCTGETFAQRRAEGLFTSGVISFSATSASDAVSRWKNNAATCKIMMSTNVTKGVTAVALDASNGWVLVMK